MNTGVMQMMSRALGRHVSYSFVIPDVNDAGPGPYPVLYQLHGSSDDHAAWINRSNLARHVSRIPMIVICPDGGLSFWMNLGPRDRYEDFMMRDLPEHVANTFNVKPGKAAIGGLSMGGFGTLRLALKYHDRFASAWGHSSAVWTREELQERNAHPLRDAAEADLFALSTELAGKDLPVLSFDCGTEDFLIEHNRRFHAHLNQLGIAHTYNEHTGAHTWDYWDTHVKEALAQHMQAFGITPRA